MKKILIVVISSILIVSCGSGGQGGVNITNTLSPNATSAFQHLNNTMDQYHQTFSVYTNQDDAGNHYFPTGRMGDLSAITIDTNWITNCQAGTSCIRQSFTATASNQAGIYWQNPKNNWGTVPKGGYDLTGASNLQFWVKGEGGGERVEFFVGGITGPNPDSIPKISTGYITLTNTWQLVTIDLTSRDLSHIIGGFGWVTNSTNNPNGVVFYLDNIRFNKSRLNDPRFLVSYETKQVISPDRYIRNVAYTYDNALALLAYLARGTTDDIRRAGLISDAFILAQNNDRFYTDLRLRNSYMAGDSTDLMTGKIRMPGWWDPTLKSWIEDKDQVGTHTGNLAWAIIALLTYYENVGGVQYLNAGISLGNWIESKTRDTRGSGGYTGGYQGWEPLPTKITWKSTEHNIDVYVAFSRLYNVTGNTQWKDRAQRAKTFVDSMWNATGQHFWTGTFDDGITINQTNIPLDIQPWAVLALNAYGVSLQWGMNNCYLISDGFEGFDFNTDLDGIWLEGTSQMVTAFQATNQKVLANRFLTELRNAQQSAINTNGLGIVAASHDGVTTGFTWDYFSRLHVGATAWFLFAELNYNPYWDTATN